MAKKKKKMTKSETSEFPNYTFEDGSLKGLDVRSLIAEGTSGIVRITRYIDSECPEAGFSYLCTGSIVYELSLAIGALVNEHKGSERELLVILDDFFGSICWLPPLVYLASKKFGYSKKWDLLTTDNEDDLRLAVESIRDLMKKAYIDNPLSVEHDPRCGCIDSICGCYD